jgi:transcriptional regulator with XRE-family HTH domain
MKNKNNVLLPKSRRILAKMGENIRLSRLRRKLSTQQISERAGISRATLWNIERGKESVSIGAYFQVLLVLGLEKDFLKIASDDILGQKLQDLNLIRKKRAPSQ